MALIVVYLVTDPFTQLLVNALLSTENVIMAVSAACLCDKIGRRKLFITSTAGSFPTAPVLPGTKYFTDTTASALKACSSHSLSKQYFPRFTRRVVEKAWPMQSLLSFVWPFINIDFVMFSLIRFISYSPILRCLRCKDFFMRCYSLN